MTERKAAKLYYDMIYSYSTLPFKSLYNIQLYKINIKNKLF